MLFLSVCLLSGCGKDSTSFEEEYISQQEFNEQADEVKESAEGEVDEIAEKVKEEDEQIREQARDTAESLDSKGREEFKQGIEQMEEWQNTGMGMGEMSLYYTLKSYNFLREITPQLIGGSWFAAVVLWFISVGNKRRRAVAVFGLGVGVPLVLFLIRYAVPWLMLMF